jgi:hypothetical protein
LKRRFEVGRGGGAWSFVICASARPVHSDSVNTTIAVSFLVDKDMAGDYKNENNSFVIRRMPWHKYG